MEELEANRKAARNSKPQEDPNVIRTRESLRLARTELQRQLAATEHPARKDQLTQAVAEIDKRLSAL